MTDKEKLDKLWEAHSELHDPATPPVKPDKSTLELKVFRQDAPGSRKVWLQVGFSEETPLSYQFDQRLVSESYDNNGYGFAPELFEVEQGHTEIFAIDLPESMQFVETSLIVEGKNGAMAEGKIMLEPAEVPDKPKPEPEKPFDDLTPETLIGFGKQALSQLSRPKQFLAVLNNNVSGAGSLRAAIDASRANKDQSIIVVDESHKKGLINKSGFLGNMGDGTKLYGLHPSGNHHLDVQAMGDEPPFQHSGNPLGHPNLLQFGKNCLISDLRLGNAHHTLRILGSSLGYAIIHCELHGCGDDPIVAGGNTQGFKGGTVQFTKIIGNKRPGNFVGYGFQGSYDDNHTGDKDHFVTFYGNWIDGINWRAFYMRFGYGHIFNNLLTNIQGNIAAIYLLLNARGLIHDNVFYGQNFATTTRGAKAMHFNNHIMRGKSSLGESSNVDTPNYSYEAVAGRQAIEDFVYKNAGPRVK